MEVVGHQAERQQAHREAGGGIGEQADEGVVVVVGVEDFGPAIAAVEGMVAEAAGGSACGPWHGVSLASERTACKGNSYVPFAHA